jgi:hypothetical protein
VCRLKEYSKSNKPSTGSPSLSQMLPEQVLIMTNQYGKWRRRMKLGEGWSRRAVLLTRYKAGKTRFRGGGTRSRDMPRIQISFHHQVSETFE